MFALKPKKLTFSNFGNLRKKKQEDGEEYVCPMELGHASGSSSQKGFRTGLDMRLYEEDDLDRLEQVSPAPCTHRHSDAPWKLCTLTHEVCHLHMPEKKNRDISEYPQVAACFPVLSSALCVLYPRYLGSVFRGDAEAQDPCGPCCILCHLHSSHFPFVDLSPLLKLCERVCHIVACSWQMEDSEGTVRQIGAFSEGINNLTVSVDRELKMSL